MAHLNNEEVKALGNQAMLRKMTAPGFIFVPVGQTPPLAPASMRPAPE
jgi:hypothetical protein